METIRVFTYANNRDGSVTIGAPVPGEFFQAEDSGMAVKRKSPQEPRMLRRLLEERTMSLKVSDGADISADTIFMRTGRTVSSHGLFDEGEFFLSESGMIGAEGIAKWSADEGREILVIAD